MSARSEHHPSDAEKDRFNGGRYDSLLFGPRDPARPPGRWWMPLLLALLLAVFFLCVAYL